MTKYEKPLWLEEFPKSRVPSYPRYRGDGDAPVVVVGGGLTGCLTAYGLAAAGQKVLLLEADRIGRGETARATGWIADEPDVRFADLERALGLRGARRAWQAWRRAALDFTALLRRLEIKCRLEPRASVTIASTPDQAVRLKRDQKARRDAGLDAVALPARSVKAEVAADAAAALRSRDGATIDPYRACVGIAAAALERGASLFEGSAVRRITFDRRIANVVTEGGTIRTRRVVIATGTPTAVFRSLQRHFWFHTRSAVVTEPVPARVRKALGARRSVVRDSAQPPHVVLWVDDDRLLVSGADSAAVPERQRAKTAVQRTGQLMYELSVLYPDISGIQPAYGWSSDYARTEDGLPYVGPHRNFPHQLFAFGDSSHGVTGAYLASRILLRHCVNELDPADEVFGFHR